MSLKEINVNNSLVTNVDDKPIAGSVNLVKSGGVAAEFQKVFKDSEIKLFQDIEGGKTFDTSGYRDYAKNATCKVSLDAGNYTMPVLTDGYQWELYKYISDNEGEAIWSAWQNAQRTITLNGGDYVFIFRNVPSAGTVSNWTETHTAYVKNIEVGIENNTSIEGRLDAEISRAQTAEQALQQGISNITKETQRAKNEEEKIDYKASLIGSDIFGKQEVSKNLVPYRNFKEDGFSEQSNAVTTRIFPAGNYQLPSIAGSGYSYCIYSYVSDTEGIQCYNWTANNITIFKATEPFIVTYRNESVVKLTDEQIAYIDNNFPIFFIKENDVGYSLSKEDRLSKYYNGVIPAKKYDITFKSCDNPTEINYFSVSAYNGSTNIGVLATSIGIGETKTVTIPANTTRIFFFNSTYVTSDTQFEINIIESDTTKATIQSLERSIDTLNDVVFPSNPVVSFCDDIPSDVLVEMYFPNITSSWKIVRLVLNEGTIAFDIIDGNNTYSIKTSIYGHISPFFHGENIVGYFIADNPDGTYKRYYNESGFAVNVNNITNIENSPKIKAYLNRTENIVLLGDSMFGYRPENYLIEYLIEKTDKFIVNAGFPGCRAAWRTADGSNDWDNMCLIGVVDALVSGDFTAISNAIGRLDSGRQYFKQRLASLKTADLTKPTTVFIEYGNNDVTGGNLIGNLWDKTQTIAGCDKTKYVEAINYGVMKLSQAFPNIKIIVINPGWRMIGGTVDPEGGTSGDAVAPYEYTNISGITFYQYLDAIKENCERCGVRLWDFFRTGGRCAFNWNYYSVDSSHFNMKGYEMLATLISEEVKEIA